MFFYDGGFVRLMNMYSYFFFQAEDGIRDGHVTGVQTCALPIFRSTASQVLNSDQAPDVLEYNKGNATAGLLSSQGLLRELDDAVAEYGWDDMLAPSLQTTARYDEQGIKIGRASWSERSQTWRRKGGEE